MRSTLAALLVVAFGAVPPLCADPIQVQPPSFYRAESLLLADGSFDTSGSFFFDGVASGVFGREIFNSARNGCGPCAVGDPLDLSASFQLRGPSFLSGGPELSVWGEGLLHFRTPTVSVPVFPTLPAAVTVLAPFEFTGDIALFGEPGTVPVFAGPLFGIGTARATLVRRGDSLVFSQLVYQFAEPIPEPATLTLLATGLAGIGARAWRRRR